MITKPLTLTTNTASELYRSIDEFIFVNNCETTTIVYTLYYYVYFGTVYRAAETSFSERTLVSYLPNGY